MPTLPATALGAALNCWSAAAAQYDLPVELLYAIAYVESRHDPSAIAHADDGTHSVGLMQVNSSWFPTLATHGIDARRVREPCVNIQVGAWILSQEVRRYGATWHAIGAYYAGPFTARTAHRKLPLYRSYAQRVLFAWRQLRDRGPSRADPQ